MHNPAEDDVLLNKVIYVPIEDYVQRAKTFHLECRRLFGYADDPLNQVHEFDI